MKEKFKEIYNKYIKREGAEELLEWISKTDFFTAPASTKYHNSCHGGLVDHSINVFQELTKICLNDEDAIEEETIAIVGLLHDLCKANYYTETTRNVQDKKTKQWSQVPYYAVDEKFPYGHGEKSVFLIERFMGLTPEEAISIRFHMGAYEGAHAYNNLSNAYVKFPLSLKVFIADIRATYLLESR